MAPGGGDSGELLDRGEHPPDLIRGNLRDMGRMVRWLGVPRHLRRFLDSLDLPRGRPVSLLDLATGSGWLPRAARVWAKTHGVRMEATGVDRNPQVLAVARELSQDAPSIRWVEADVLSDSLLGRPWDIVTCSMALHHFDPGPASQLLSRIHDAARLGWWVCDLSRSNWLQAAAWLASRLLSRNPLTRHDGPLSARRAYSGDAVRDLLLHAGAGASELRAQFGIWVVRGTA